MRIKFYELMLKLNEMSNNYDDINFKKVDVYTNKLNGIEFLFFKHENEVFEVITIDSLN